MIKRIASAMPLLLIACDAQHIGSGNQTSTGITCLETVGASGNACFAWNSFTPMSVPMAAGSKSEITIVTHSTVASVVSTQPSVATVSLLNGSVQVTGNAVGLTDLVLLDPSNAEIDRTTLHVVSTESLERKVGSQTSPVLVLEHTTQTFHVATVTGGVHTVGVGAVHFSLSGNAHQAFTIIGPVGDAVAFIGDAGDGRIVATADQASAQVDVRFVPLSNLTGLSAQLTLLQMNADGSAQAHVAVTPLTADGPVYGANCTWTTSDSSVQVLNAGVDLIDGPPAVEADFALAHAGSYSVTCSFAGQSAAAQIAY
jgi:hypothetical protein